MPITVVLPLTHLLVFRALQVMLNMFRSLLCCAAENLLSIFVVNVQISSPCVIGGRMHWLKTFLFKHVGSVPFIIVL